MIVLAVASGTSADGLDVTIVDLDWSGRGEEAGRDVRLEVLQAQTVPWPDGVGEQVLALLPPATATARQWCETDTAVGRAVAAVAVEAVAGSARAVDLVVSPGQTVYHDVRDDRCLGTLQIGQPAWVAEATGLPVVSDLRARDVAAGGHGAPLASTFDALWLSAPGGSRAALNLGGIANVTVIRDGHSPLAWDTGPANCLLDVAAARVTRGRQSCDVDGGLAAAGQVREDLLGRLLDHPHFARRPPASTGREEFSALYLDDALAGLPPVEGPDLLATLTALTATTVARALTPYSLDEVIVSGGGTRNPALMAALTTALTTARSGRVGAVTGGPAVVQSDARGVPAQAKEGAMWALLGFLTWYGVPGTTPATGASARRVLGRISPGTAPLRLPEPQSFPRRLDVLTVEAVR